MQLETAVSPRIVWDKPPAPRHVGLALGGGVARGLAHIGVLEVLEEYHIPIDFIAGTSVGALVGGLYAAGLSAQRLRALLEGFSWGTISTLSRPSLSLSSLHLSLRGLPMGLLNMDRMITWIEQVLGGSVTFDQLNIPFAAIAADIVTGEMVVMNDGALGLAIRASCSVPGVFTPCRRNGRLLVDGAVVNNLPAQVLRLMGAEYVIAVDLLPEPGDKIKEPETILELSLTSLYTLVRATQGYGLQADCLIEPDINEYSMVDLGAAQELIELGRAAAEAQVERIKRDLGL
ncbi:MAG TPA: patatin-like phospholipase family protein [Caldilineaceae bacterium]|nr:patatin-like phospholipase family protein [Caldilineaceae bacterium]